MVIQPRERVALHACDLSHLDSLKLSMQPAGYEATTVFDVEPLLPPAQASTQTFDECGGLCAESSVQVCY